MPKVKLWNFRVWNHVKPTIWGIPLIIYDLCGRCIFFFGTPWAKPSLGTLGWMFHMFHIPGKLIKRKCCGDLPTVFFLIILLFAKTEGYTPKYCDYVRYNWIWWDIATIGGMLDSVNDKNHRWERNWGVNQGVKSCNQWQILVRLKIGFAISGQQNIGQW